MIEQQLFGAWEFDRGDNVAAATIVALDRLNPPDLQVELLSNYGDHIVVELVRGEWLEPDRLLYVERRGLYEVAREERWGARRVLVLRAYPAR